MALPNLILFGGTFDPPHQAHVDSAEAALKRFPRAKMLVTPTPFPASAGGGQKIPHASFPDRMAMCSLAFARLSLRAKIDPIELGLTPPNFTVDTLAAALQREPKARLAYLMGEDQLASLPQWHEPERLLLLASLIVVPRKTATSASSLLITAGRAARALDLTAIWQPKQRRLWLPQLKQGIYILPRSVGNAASSLARADLAQTGEAQANWLPETVATYVKEHKIYPRRS